MTLGEDAITADPPCHHAVGVVVGVRGADTPDGTAIVALMRCPTCIARYWVVIPAQEWCP